VKDNAATDVGLESLRREMTSEIGRVEGVLGVQIGAVEKTLTAKLDGMKWKILGPAIVQVVAALGVIFAARPQAAISTIESLASMVGFA